MLSTESRMRGDMQVRFGGRYGKTYCRKAVRRPVPSLRTGEGGSLIDLVMKQHDCNAYGAISRLEHGYYSADTFSFQGKISPKGIRQGRKGSDQPAR